MRKIFCLTAVLALAACDRPQDTVKLSCEGYGGKYLVDVALHKTHADLKIRKIGPGYRDIIMIDDDPYWLVQQLPEIDDEMTVSLPVNPESSFEPANGYRGAQYVLEDKLSFSVISDTESGSVLFDMSQERKSLSSNMNCKIVFNWQPVKYDKIPADKLRDVKNCVAYISENLLQVERAYLVRDADTQNFVEIAYDKMPDILGVDAESVHHFFFSNMYNYQEEMLAACDAAARLREYVRANAGPSQAKLYKCITDLDRKVLYDYAEMRISLRCGNAIEYRLTADEALALSPAWDYSNMKRYDSFAHIPEPHEQDACDVLERVNAAIDAHCEKPAESKPAQ